MEIFVPYQPPTTKIPFDVNKKFHVFLSFRGEDVRNTFVSHLYGALSAVGLRVFLDSEELEKGKDIDSNLQTAIETSDILIPIFSKCYAESTWCLEEAARMRRSHGFIIPLFYDVKPCDVRYPQREGGLFTQAFQKHYSHLDRQDENTIEEWKSALHQISSLSGWTLEAEFGSEGRLVRRVVKDVLDTLMRVPLDVPMHLVGLERDKRELLNRLYLSSSNIRSVRVGISGIGGVGKTTLAKVVYNEIHRGFDACCFLSDIGATAQNSTTLMGLQGRILRSLLNYNREVLSVDEGRTLMRDRLRGVRALVILDNVNDREQLHAVDGDWFGHGSRIIITSRDQHILKLAKVDSVLKMRGLEDDEALQLFSWHAFSMAIPKTPYLALSTKIAKACLGHPLSLEVIGAHLFGKEEPNDIQCWEEAVYNIGGNPGVSRVLRTSYEGLSHVEKEIFLHIACYFVGERKRDCDIFWEVLYPNKVQTAIKNLLLKMLINISGPQDLLGMHDRLREMGRGIQEEVDNNSRLWLPTGAHKALDRDRAEGVNMLAYTGQNVRERVSLHSMPSLRYLFLQNTKVVDNIGKLAPNLIWIKISNCEFGSDMCTWILSRNTLQFDGSWSQVRILSLEECASLTKIPNTLDGLVNLQCLYIQDCTALTTLPNTLGNLSQLKQFKLCGCVNLTSLPDTVGKLVQLKELYLGGCADLKSLPETVGNLAQLQVLSLYGCTGLRILPNKMGDMAQLQVLNLHDCSGLQRLPYTVGRLRKLRMLNIHGCSGLGSFRGMIIKLAQLRELNRSAGLGGLVQKFYNVFCSFRGIDVRTTFVGHLYESLSAAGVRVFVDSEQPLEAEDFYFSLQTAMETSDILIPIFSKNYANSSWCLREAAWMCRSNSFIIPLFYDVEPCDVGYPERKGGPFAEAFQEHYSRLDRYGENTIEEWKNALRQISCLSSWTREV